MRIKEKPLNFEWLFDVLIKHSGLQAVEKPLPKGCNDKALVGIAEHTAEVINKKIALSWFYCRGFGIDIITDNKQTRCRL